MSNETLNLNESKPSVNGSILGRVNIDVNTFTVADVIEVEQGAGERNLEVVIDADKHQLFVVKKD